MLVWHDCAKIIEYFRVLFTVHDAAEIQLAAIPKGSAWIVCVEKTASRIRKEYSRLLTHLYYGLAIAHVNFYWGVEKERQGNEVVS